MSLRAILGQNLVRLTRNATSISDICRDIGIHRSQFERYLKGKALPSEEVIEKIASYFGVKGTDLVADPASDGRDSWHSAGGRSPENAPALRPGTYFSNFRQDVEPRLVMRSAIFVRQRNGQTNFRRVTGWSPGADRSWAFSRGNHEGTITQHLNWLYLSGRNRQKIGEPSLIAVHWAPTSAPLLVGSGLILSENGPTHARIAIQSDELKRTARAAIKASHALDIDDPALDRQVRAHLLNEDRKNSYSLR